MQSSLRHIEKVLGEQGNTVDFVVGTREQNKKIVGNKGTQNILENSETKPISGKEYEFYHDLTHSVNKKCAYSVNVIDNFLVFLREGGYARL